MKQTILFFLLFTSSFLEAQLSDLHYLPPLKQGRNNQGIRQQRVYLSTPETTPFTVNVYRGTNLTIYQSFTLSNASPQQLTLPNGDNNITLVNNNNTGVVLTNSGLRFEAPGGEQFYVNYRGRSSSQAASLTAKGRSALGTNFKWGGVPNLGTHRSLSNTLGIMATEDNTTVTLSGYDPNCVFRMGGNVSGITDDSYTLTLDANESFVFEAYVGDTPIVANREGWLGASVVADKNIVVSNGSINFGVLLNDRPRDAGIDQSVPIDGLGKDYAFIRGRGEASGDGEFVVVIATEDNTAVFVNGSATAFATLNNGDYTMIPSSFYRLNNVPSNSVGANMYVEASKNVYAYQCLSGDDRVVTVGLNLVGPISCSLPDTIDNIPNITNIAGATLTGGVTIIAPTDTPDANIQVTDGGGSVTLPTSNPVPGSTDWKTFYISNLTGNVSVQSTGSISVGFLGFNNSRGVAGYFSGFDIAPDIDIQIAGSTCFPGSTLEILGGQTYDAYQWYRDGIAIAGATTDSYIPTTAGEYFVRIFFGTCGYDSNPITVYNCNPDIVLNKTVDQNNVNEGTLVNFTITVENVWGLSATNVVLTDMLPNGLTFVSASVSSGSFIYPNWTLGTMSANQLETMTLTARAKITNIYLNTQTYTNTVTNSQDQIDRNDTTDNPSVDVTVNRIPPTTVITNRRITTRVNRH